MKQTTITQTPLQIVVRRYEERNGCPFVPTRQMFYQRVGINQKRFGMILRGDVSMTTDEVKALADFFKVPTNELF